MTHTTTTKLTDLKDAISCNTLSKNKKGNYVARWSFYYTSGMTAEKKAELVTTVFPNAIIVDKGEIWKPFRGGASVANQSHWYVEFNFKTI